MSDRMRIVLEIGPKGRKVVAGAIDWPGLERGGRNDDVAIEKLLAYVSRYAPVAERAGLAAELERQAEAPEVVERYPGNTSTDFWGIAHVPSPLERDTLPEAELERRLALLRATWAQFDATVARVAGELRPGARGGGRTREQVIRHVLLNEPDQFAKKVGVRVPLETVLDPGARAAYRDAFVDGICRANAAGPMVGRSWTLAFLLRRTAQHVMDHAWEMEDRNPAAARVAERARTA
ncbi:MAG TPA: hypothetical protein VHR55_03505 [Candidatus Limnocylindria bacterium]|nr:hypothetical protein [Candidatus Limnocylindria bacterium]